MYAQGSSTCSWIKGSKVASLQKQGHSNLGSLMATFLQSKSKVETNEMSLQHVMNIQFIKTLLLLLRQGLSM